MPVFFKQKKKICVRFRPSCAHSISNFQPLVRSIGSLKFHKVPLDAFPKFDSSFLTNTRHFDCWKFNKEVLIHTQPVKECWTPIIACLHILPFSHFSIRKTFINHQLFVYIWILYNSYLDFFEKILQVYFRTGTVKEGILVFETNELPMFVYIMALSSKNELLNWFFSGIFGISSSKYWSVFYLSI